MSIKILTVVGARPQFIKAAPVSHAIRVEHQELLIHTGQHYDEGMSEVFFRELNIPQPDVNLGVGSSTHAQQTADMLPGLEKEMQAFQPDWVLLYGDTNSTLAGALAAAKLNLNIAHIEAGLRSFNRTMPEEINRVLTDHLSTALFCPTDTAVQNLQAEGITNGVYRVGDVMVDALYQMRKRLDDAQILSELGLKKGEFYLATIHRPANTDSHQALNGIFGGFAALDFPIVLPAHPRLKAALEREALTPPNNVKLIPPAGYLNMVALLDGAKLVITDSGGLQKEAYIMARHCVTVRPQTEWVETIEAGWNRLVEANSASINAGVQAALAANPTTHPNLYGDGQASQEIVKTLANYDDA